jgi:hypothetical protein
MEQIHQTAQPLRRISKQQYDDWRRGFVFEALRNQRYGQSFCRHFDIKDNILFYSSTVAQAHGYIMKTYIQR